jgi:hypothetical protein
MSDRTMRYLLLLVAGILLCFGNGTAARPW